MKKFLSILLSVLVLFNSIFNSGFVLWDDVGNLIENSQESSQTEDQNFTQESNEENTETNSDFLWLITKGWQSGQVLDNGLNSSVDIENIALELEQSLSGWQSVQSWSFGNITNEESGLDNDILPPLTTLGMKWAWDSNIIFDVSFADGKTNLPTWRTAYWLGGDYTNNPKLKFDSSWDWLKSPEFILTTGAIATVRTKANGSSFSGKAIFTDQNDNIVFEFTDFSPNKEKNIIFNVPNTVTQIKLTYEKWIWNLWVGSFKLEYSNDENSWTETSTPKLKITEIYFDWDENWFELTNLWNDTFSGELGLSGNLNFTFSANIPSWVSKVFANSLYSMFQTWKNIQTIVNSINFVNEEFNLDLIRSGQVLDNFFVHSSYVDYYYQDYKTSFEKIWTWDSWTTTVVGLNSDRYYNTNRWIAANPTKYFITWENLIDVTLNKNPYNPDPGNTGNDLNIPIDCNNFYVNWILDISEVYYWSWIYPSYVELNITDDVGDYYPQIKLWGSALDQEIVFSSIELQAGKRFLITDSDTRYNEW